MWYVLKTEWIVRVPWHPGFAASEDNKKHQTLPWTPEGPPVIQRPGLTTHVVHGPGPTAADLLLQVQGRLLEGTALALHRWTDPTGGDLARSEARGVHSDGMSVAS